MTQEERDYGGGYVCCRFCGTRRPMRVLQIWEHADRVTTGSRWQCIDTMWCANTIVARGNVARNDDRRKPVSGEGKREKRAISQPRAFKTGVLNTRKAGR